VKRLAEIVALVAALSTCAYATAGNKPSLAMLTFNGPGAKQAEIMVVRTLRRKATIIPMTTWQKAAKKLFAPSHSAEDIADVAADVGANVVITGVVKRDGKR